MQNPAVPCIIFIEHSGTPSSFPSLRLEKSGTESAAFASVLVVWLRRIATMTKAKAVTLGENAKALYRCDKVWQGSDGAGVILPIFIVVKINSFEALTAHHDPIQAITQPLVP
jgi:hypothetical protein